MKKQLLGIILTSGLMVSANAGEVSVYFYSPLNYFGPIDLKLTCRDTNNATVVDDVFETYSGEESTIGQVLFDGTNFTALRCNLRQKIGHGAYHRISPTINVAADNNESNEAWVGITFDAFNNGYLSNYGCDSSGDFNIGCSQ
jgi:hypothetical protein